MTRAASGSVDLVVVGSAPDVIAGAIASAERGERVLVVLGSSDRPHIRRVRRSLQCGGAVVRRLVTVVIDSELACVDGIGQTEAVVLRHVPSGRLTAFNARLVRRNR